MPEKSQRPREQMNTKKNPNFSNITADNNSALTQRGKKFEEILPYLLSGEADD